MCPDDLECPDTRWDIVPSWLGQYQVRHCAQLTWNAVTPGETLCPADSECPDTRWDIVPSWLGIKGILFFTELIIVIPNFFLVAVCSSSPSPCSAGSYSLGSSTSCTACPAGYQCPNASATPEACGAGTYSLGSQTVCTGCPAGQACPSTTTATDAYACSAGKVLLLHLVFCVCVCVFFTLFAPCMPVQQVECCFCTLVFVWVFFLPCLFPVCLFCT